MSETLLGQRMVDAIIMGECMEDESMGDCEDRGQEDGSVGGWKDGASHPYSPVPLSMVHPPSFPIRLLPAVGTLTYTTSHRSAE